MKVISKMIGWWKTRRENRRVEKYFGKMYGLINSSVEDRIRGQFSFPKSGEDKVLDLSIKEAQRFFFLKGPNAKKAKEALGKKSIKIYRWLCSDAYTREQHKLELRLWHLHYIAENNEDTAKFMASQHREFYQLALLPLKVSDLPKEHAALKEMARSEKERAYPKPEAPLLSVELKDLTLPTSWLSVFFVISGYVHTNLVYDHFGVDVSQFFTLGDYLAGSIKQISLALFAITGYLLSVISRYRSGKQFDTTLIFSYFREMPLFTLSALSVPCAFLVFLYFAYVRSWNVFWLFAPLSVIIFFQSLVARKVYQTFKNPFSATATAMVILIFLASIVSQSHKRITGIEKGRDQKIFAVETAKNKFTSEEFFFLGGNERYIFLLEKKDGAKVRGAAVIIPLVEIEHVDMLDLGTAQPRPAP
ncbi:MAG: hypothetical protein MPK09_07510 [Gammaproteobacteria bacterium]|nr:hypothetical protein [Gammaproteobacteria bacterium]